MALKHSEKLFYVRVRETKEVLRFDKETMEAEYLEGGKWLSADGRPASLFMDLVDSPSLSIEEIAKLPK